MYDEYIQCPAEETKSKPTLFPMSIEYKPPTNATYTEV